MAVIIGPADPTENPRPVDPIDEGAGDPDTRRE